MGPRGGKRSSVLRWHSVAWPWAQLRLGREPRRRFHVRRNPFTKRPFSKRAGSASTKRLPTPNSSTRSYSSVESCSPCTWETSQRRSVGKWEGRSRSSAGTSRDDTSNLCRTSESCRLGEQAAGLRASIRLRSSSSWSKSPGPRSYLTIRAFLKVRRKSWLQDGKHTIGSRSRNSWLRFCAGRGNANGPEYKDDVRCTTGNQFMK